jgi:hypothetical protein
MPNVRGKKLGPAIDLIHAAGINAVIEKQPDLRRLKGRQPGQVLKQSPGPKRPIPTGTAPYRKIVLRYYVGPIKTSAKDSCPTKALSRALRGEDPADTQKYLDRQCDEVGVQYRFSSRVDEATLTSVTADSTAELRVLCKSAREDGKKVKYCDVVRVPAEEKNFYYQTPCELNERKRELECRVVRKRKDKPKDTNDVIGTVTVPKNADDLVLAVGDAEEFTKNDTYRIGFTQNWRLLTTDQYVLRYSCIRIRVLTGSGALADRAKVALAIPPGMSPDTVVEQTTDKRKGAYFCMRFLKPGKVHLVATARGANGAVIHGVKTIKVEELREERVLLDERRIRPSGKHNGTTLFEVVSRQQLQHEAQLATGGGALAAAPAEASTAPERAGDPGVAAHPGSGGNGRQLRRARFGSRQLHQPCRHIEELGVRRRSRGQRDRDRRRVGPGDADRRPRHGADRPGGRQHRQRGRRQSDRPGGRQLRERSYHGGPWQSQSHPTSARTWPARPSSGGCRSSSSGVSG